MPLSRALVALPLLLALGACSLFGSDSPKPSPLQSVSPSIAGRLVWNARIGDVDFPLQVATPSDRFVVADSAGRVVALRAQDGAEVWRGDAGAKLMAGVGSDGRWAAVVTRDLDLVVMDAGREIWRKRLSAPVHTAPLVAGERVFVLGVEDPADVRVEEAAMQRRMHVLLLVGVPVVMAVQRRPPEDGLLRRAHREQRQDELPGPRGLERAVGEVAMVARRDAEHADHVQPEGEQDGRQRDAGPEGGERHQVDDHEGGRLRIDDVVVVLGRCGQGGGSERMPKGTA